MKCAFVAPYMGRMCEGVEDEGMEDRGFSLVYVDDE